MFSAITSAMVATPASVSGAYVGTSGFSYPSWRGGFYPADGDPKTFLSFYADRFDTVELNTTGYRLPAEEQFARWASQTPDGFRFAVKMPLGRLDRVGTFVERVGLLGDRLGPLRVVVQSKRDDGLLTFLQGSLPPELEVGGQNNIERGARYQRRDRVTHVHAIEHKARRLRINANCGKRECRAEAVTQRRVSTRINPLCTAANAY